MKNKYFLGAAVGCFFGLLNYSCLFAFEAEVVGMYGVPQDSYASLKELGIDTIVIGIENSTTTKEVQEKLDAAHALGLKVIFGIYETPLEYRKTLSAVETYKSHPAIYFWYLADKPDVQGLEPFTIDELNKFLHSSDFLKRPTFITISDLNYAPKNAPHPKIHGKAYPAYKNLSDVAGVVRLAPAKDVKEYLKNYVLTEFKDRRWWGIVSLRQNPESLKRAVGYFIEAGASGILYYTYRDNYSGFDLRGQAPIQKALKEINFDIRKSTAASSGSGVGGQAPFPNPYFQNPALGQQGTLTNLQQPNLSSGAPVNQTPP